MIPTNNGCDDIDTWPGEHYKKTKMKGEYIGRVQPPKGEGMSKKDGGKDVMSLEELVTKMEAAEKKHHGNWAMVHVAQDDLLLEYINSKKVKDIFERTTKWYT